MLEKEVPYREIPADQLDLYHKAEEVEWEDWLDKEAVDILTLEETESVETNEDPCRILRLRFVYRDKNAAIRTPKHPLPVRAKARLCAQGSREPLALEGRLKPDSPTVQRIGVMLFIQIIVNSGWQSSWIKVDVKSAFLQGVMRDSESKGHIYLRPPRNRPLKGVIPGVLLRVRSSVYGLPDAPRAWWEEVTSFFGSLGWTHCRMDVAFMVKYSTDG